MKYDYRKNENENETERKKNVKDDQVQEKGNIEKGKKKNEG